MAQSVQSPPQPQQKEEIIMATQNTRTHEVTPGTFLESIKKDLKIKSTVYLRDSVSREIREAKEKALTSSLVMTAAASGFLMGAY